MCNHERDREVTNDIFLGGGGHRGRSPRGSPRGAREPTMQHCPSLAPGQQSKRPESFVADNSDVATLLSLAPRAHATFMPFTRSGQHRAREKIPP